MDLVIINRSHGFPHQEARQIIRPVTETSLVVVSRPRVFPDRRGYRVAKRAMDLAMCLLSLPAILFVMFLCAIAIQLDSPGPVFFVQERIGKGGHRFWMFKLRTMRHDLDDGFHRIFMRAFVKGEIGVSENGNRRNDDVHQAFRKAFAETPPAENGNGVVYKPAQSSQITRVGHFLRKTSLDELPQVFNVLKGEMSIVGPRPNVPWEVEEYHPWHHERLEVLPGITGLAQVRGRSGISFDEIVKHDIQYVENQSLTLDLRILWWTVTSFFLGRGAE
jgi:lipopolysaccharide/colanic/teichoic acid biosynthesis glycosyltransferase